MGKGDHEFYWKCLNHFPDKVSGVGILGKLDEAVGRAGIVVDGIEDGLELFFLSEVGDKLLE